MVQDTSGVGPAHKQAKILVVDDERSLVDLVRSYLEAEGFAVLAAYDGVSAVERTRQEHPDLVILDLMLPGIDGIEVCRASASSRIPMC